MLILYIITALFIAWIWIDYYRLIDIYEKENLWLIVLTFLLGGTSVFVVLGINHFVLDGLLMRLNGEFFHDFFYCVIKIGVIEEFAKTIPFIIIYYFFRNHINEPLDYLVFFSVSALGFSATENALYFQNHGPSIINNRAILSTVGHMFDTSLIAYGVIRYLYYHKKDGLLIIGFFFLLAAASHGFYDFWLMFEGAQPIGFLITILYFLVTISLFSAILNNALNNSTFFTYKKMVDQNKVMGKLLVYYCIVFLIQFAFLSYFENVEYAMFNMVHSLYLSGFIAFVTVVRLSRFKLIQNRWKKLNPELPFALSYIGYSSTRSSSYKLSIKGNDFCEIHINNYLGEYFLLNPLAPPSNYLIRSRLAFMERKVFLQDDEAFYVVKVFVNNETGPYDTMLLKAKTLGTTFVKDTYPIVALMKISNMADLENPEATSKTFDFQEWAFLKPKLEAKNE